MRLRSALPLLIALAFAVEPGIVASAQESGPESIEVYEAAGDPVECLENGGTPERQVRASIFPPDVSFGEWSCRRHDIHHR